MINMGMKNQNNIIANIDLIIKKTFGQKYNIFLSIAKKDIFNFFFGGANPFF